MSLPGIAFFVGTALPSSRSGKERAGGGVRGRSEEAQNFFPFRD